MSRTTVQQSIIATETPAPLFCSVESGVFRCAYPGPQHVPHLLQTVKVKTVLLLSIEGLQLPVLQMLRVADPPVAVAHATKSVWRTRQELCDGLVHEALDFILDKSCHPLVLMCPTGSFQTSVVVGCLRRMQHWCFSSIVGECALFARDGVVPDPVSIFIEYFSPPAAEVGIANVRSRLDARYVVGGPDRRIPAVAAGALSPGGTTTDSLAGTGSVYLDPIDQWPRSPALNGSMSRAGVKASDDPANRSLTDGDDDGANADTPEPPEWWVRYCELRAEDEVLKERFLAAGGSVSQVIALPPLPPKPSATAVEAVTKSSALPIVTKDLQDAAERKALKARLKSIVVHEIFRFCSNPPPVGPSVKFSKADSIVEEDDD